MKLNRGLLVGAALVAGSLAVMGCSKASNDSASVTRDETQEVADDDVSSTASGATDGVTNDSASADEGTDQYARFGRGGGRRGGGRGGFRRGGGHEGRRGFGHGRGPRAWWRFW